MPEAELLSDAKQRLRQAMQSGTGAIEIKSGYGLTAEAELKMLRVIRALAEEASIPMKATFLVCHACPKAIDAASWSRHMVEDVLPTVAREGLADYVDAFCEKGYFGLKRMQLLLDRASELGMKAKVHESIQCLWWGEVVCGRTSGLR